MLPVLLGLLYTADEHQHCIYAYNHPVPIRWIKINVISLSRHFGWCIWELRVL